MQAGGQPLGSGLARPPGASGFVQQKQMKGQGAPQTLRAGVTGSPGLATLGRGCSCSAWTGGALGGAGASVGKGVPTVSVASSGRKRPEVQRRHQKSPAWQLAVPRGPWVAERAGRLV